MPVRDLPAQPLDDRESVHYGSRAGDAMLLALVVGVLLINGVILWRQLGSSQDTVRHAVFFGLLLLCAYWAALVYTFKLSVSARIGPHGLAVVRGPWRTELAWREVDRLVERAQASRGTRYRWVIAYARDGRQLSIREDMVANYARFRFEVYERYRLYQDHGGTWATGGAGPFSAREATSSMVVWWAVLGGLVALPGLYLWLLLPRETTLFGPVLLTIAIVCGLLALRMALRRQTYTVDSKSIAASRLTHTLRLSWRDVSRVDRTRHPFNGILAASITAGRFFVQLAARTDARVQSFLWYPRVPEYLTLRGTGRQIRIALHRVARPDELLAWIEFYERLGRRAASTEPVRPTPIATGQRVAEPAPANLTGAEGPQDPFAQPETPAAEPLELRDATSAAPTWLASSQPQIRAGTSGPSSAPGTPPVQPTPHSLTGAPAWSQPDSGPGSSGFAGSLDQLWAESRTELDLGQQNLDEEQPTLSQEISREWARHSEPAAPADDSASYYQNLDQPDAPDEPPTASVESLGGMFTPWRSDPKWVPPELPRFGPPSGEPPKEDDDPKAYSDDEFLR